MTLGMSLFLAFDFLLIEALILILIGKNWFHMVKPHLDYLWKKVKLYKPQQGSDAIVMHRTDQPITVWLPTIFDSLSIIGRAIGLSIGVSVALSALRLLINLVRTVLNADYATLGANPGIMISWLGPTPTHVFVTMAILAIAFLPCIVIYWRYRWMWVYNFLFLFKDMVWDLQLNAMWKALFTGTPQKQIQKESFTPTPEVREPKMSTDPTELGYPDLALIPSKKLMKEYGQWKWFMLWVKGQITEFVVGIRANQVDLSNVLMPSRSGKGGSDMGEWVYQCGKFVQQTLAAGKQWTRQDKIMTSITDSVIRLASNLDENFSQDDLEKAQARAQQRLDQLYPVLWTEEVDLFDIASRHPDDVIVYFEPRRPASTNTVPEEDILRAFEA